MKFDTAYFDRGIERRGTDCVKWDGMADMFHDDEMIPMWVADMDFASPPAISEALQRVAQQGTWGYTQNGNKDTSALCGFWKRRHHVEIQPEQVLLSPCVVTGMRLAVQALTHPGDGVLIHTPVYGPFYASVTESGRTAVESPLIQDGDTWKIDFSDTEDRLRSREVRAVLFCSPHNPCGRAWTEDEVQRLLTLCRRYRVPLICDEIHADFVYAPSTFTSVLTFAQPEDEVVMLCAPSKTFNVAGLQQSAIVSKNPSILDKLKKQRDVNGVTYGNPFALAAARAAFTECDEWLDGLLDYLAGNRDLVMEHAKAWPHVHVTRLTATYLMWFDCRELGLPQKELLDRIQKAHIFVNDGLFFGKRGEGFIRFNIGCPRAQVREALSRLDSVFAVQ